MEFKPVEQETFSDFRARLKNEIARWLKTPLDFINEVLLVKDKYLQLDEQQVQVVNAFTKILNAKIKKYYNEPMTKEEVRLAGLYGVSIMSGKGIGKDAIIAMICIMFVICAYKCKIFVTGPNAETLRRVFFSEVTKWLEGTVVEKFIEQNDMLYYVRQPNVKEEKKIEFIRGQTVSVNRDPEQQAEALGGRHSPFMLWVVDEATAVKDPVFTPIETTMTQDVNIAILIFNPTTDKGYALDTHGKDVEHWIPIQLDAEKSSRVSRARIESAKKKYGEHSNHYRIYIKGLPPKVTSKSLFPYQTLIESTKNELLVDTKKKEIWGVDVGSTGDDSVIMPRVDAIFLEPDVQQFEDPNDFADYLIEQIYVKDPEYVCIDPILLGHTVYMRCHKEFMYKSPGKIVAADFRKAPKDISRFYNKRAECFVLLQDLFRKGLAQLDVIKHHQLINELSHLTYFQSTNRGYNVMQIIGKKELRKLGIPSPNQADAAALSLFKGFYLNQLRDKYDREHEEEIKDYTRYSNQRQQTRSYLSC